MLVPWRVPFFSIGGKKVIVSPYGKISYMFCDFFVSCVCVLRKNTQGGERTNKKQKTINMMKNKREEIPNISGSFGWELEPLPPS